MITRQELDARDAARATIEKVDAAIEAGAQPGEVYTVEPVVYWMRDPKTGQVVERMSQSILSPLPTPTPPPAAPAAGATA